MKRAKKKVDISGAVEASAPFRPWGAWCWLAANHGLHSKDREFSSEIGELDWVRQQLSQVIDILPVNFHSSDALIHQQNQGNLVSLPNSNRSSSLSFAPLTDPSIILLASANRSDPIDEAAKKLGLQYPKASIRLVLGEWWTGHRRTSPIAKELTSVYWYQCHDLLLPELLPNALPQGGVNIELNNETRSRSRTALVVSDDSSIRQMWLEVLPSLGFQPLAVRDIAGLPQGQVDVVFYDQAFAATGREPHLQTELPSDATLDVDQIAILRRTFPSSKIVACFSFPRWIEVERCVKSGADFILGKPFRLEGINKALADRLPVGTS